jgi:hypothetical protein
MLYADMQPALLLPLCRPHRRVPHLQWRRVSPGGVQEELALLQHLDHISDTERTTLQDFPPYPTTQSRGENASQAGL